MTEPAASRGGRVARAACASGLGVLVALAAHLAGGGSAPPILVLIAAAAVVQPVAVLLAGRSPRLWRQAAVTGLGQLAMHAVFALGGGPPTAGPGTHGATTDAMAGMPGMSTPALPALPGGTSMPAGHDMSAMAGWHIAAWLLTTVAWRWGESALRGLLAGARRLVRRTIAPAPPIGGGPVAPVPTRLAAPAVASLLLAAHPHRGPPLIR